MKLLFFLGLFTLSTITGFHFDPEPLEDEILPSNQRVGSRSVDTPVQIIVLSAAENFDQRQAILDTWAQNLPAQVSLNFFVGTKCLRVSNSCLGPTSLPAVWQKLQEEAGVEGSRLVMLPSTDDSAWPDILLAGLAWSYNTTSAVQFLKVTDKNYIDVARLLELPVLKVLPPAEPALLGHFQEAVVDKKLQPKTGDRGWLFKDFATHPSGPCFLTRGLAELLTPFHSNLRRLYNEEVSLGFWAYMLTVPLIEEPLMTARCETGVAPPSPLPLADQHARYLSCQQHCCPKWSPGAPGDSSSTLSSAQAPLPSDITNYSCTEFARHFPVSTWPSLVLPKARPHKDMWDCEAGLHLCVPEKNGITLFRTLYKLGRNESTPFLYHDRIWKANFGTWHEDCEYDHVRVLRDPFLRLLSTYIDKIVHYNNPPGRPQIRLTQLYYQLFDRADIGSFLAGLRQLKDSGDVHLWSQSETCSLTDGHTWQNIRFEDQQAYRLLKKYWPSLTESQFNHKTTHAASVEPAVKQEFFNLFFSPPVYATVLDLYKQDFAQYCSLYWSGRPQAQKNNP